jgi:hypothetical protein
MSESLLGFETDTGSTVINVKNKNENENDGVMQSDG